MICNEALYHIPKGFHKLLIFRVKLHTLIKGICCFIKPLQVQGNHEMLDNVNQYNTHGKKKKKRHACNKRRAAPSRYQAFGQSGFSSLQAFASANAWSGFPNRIQHRLLFESTAAFVGSRSIAYKCNINLLFSQDPESYPIMMVSQSTKNSSMLGIQL